MIFTTDIAGIPCQCEVLDYSAYVPMRVTGSGMGDCDPPEPEWFEFQLRDRKGYLAPWLEAKKTDADDARLLREYIAAAKAANAP